MTFVITTFMERLTVRNCKDQADALAKVAEHSITEDVIVKIEKA